MEKHTAVVKNTKFHIGVYAVIEDMQRILLVKKTRGPYHRMWDLPGGRPDHGETIEQTLQREVREETGVEVTRSIFHSNQAFVVEYTEGEEVISLHHTCLIYAATEFDISQLRTNIAEEDVGGCAWIRRSELKHLPLSKVALSCLGEVILGGAGE